MDEAFSIYRWHLIGGATMESYAVTQSDVGTNIACRMRSENFNSAFWSFGPVSQSMVGLAVRGAFDPPIGAPVLQYQWFRGDIASPLMPMQWHNSNEQTRHDWAESVEDLLAWMYAHWDD